MDNKTLVEQTQPDIPALSTPITALVPVSQQNTPPIVESTIIIQDAPFPDEEAEPISDMQPAKKRRGAFVLLSLVLLLLFSIGLYFLLPLLFPSATVTIVPMEKRLTTSTTIHITANTTQPAANQIPGRMLPSLTLSQAETVRTTGVGHQPATYAEGYITFYNGLLISQIIAAGTLLIGRDGVAVITDQTAFLPAGNPPFYGQATISAHAIMPGSAGNIAAFDITTAVSSSLLAKNTTSFYGGKDARTYPMVSQADIDSAVSHLKPTLTQSIQGAFSSQLLLGEAFIQTACVLKSVPDKRVGEEATEVQVTLSQTCQAVAYQQAALQQMVSQVVHQEAVSHFGTGYGLTGDMNINLASTAISASSQQIAAVHVNAVSKWVYQLGTTQRQQISQEIAGKGRGEALQLLSHLHGIRTVSVSLIGGYNDTLPQDANRIEVIVMYQFV